MQAQEDNKTLQTQHQEVSTQLARAEEEKKQVRVLHARLVAVVTLVVLQIMKDYEAVKAALEAEKQSVRKHAMSFAKTRGELTTVKLPGVKCSGLTDVR